MSLSNKLSVENISVQDKQVLIRVDYNVPLENGKVSDSTRIYASIPTLRYLLEAGAKKLVLVSHLGRPDGEKSEKLSLRPVAIELENIMGEPVRFVSDCVGEEAINECKTATERLVLLENLRFHVEEEGKCKRKDGTTISATAEQCLKFQSDLSSLGSVFVNDAFGTVHRGHSSISGISIEPRVAGLLVKKELSFFSKALEGPEKLHTLILGGAKVTDKIRLIEHMLPRVENIIIGGGMAFTFINILKGIEIGKSIFDAKGSEIIPNIMKKAAANNVKIHLPVDFIEASEFSENSEFRVVESGITSDWMGLDIGPKSSQNFIDIISSAKSGRVILWNGPMGVFEWPHFAKGTQSILTAIVNSTEKGCITIVGGGDSAAAVSKWNCENKISHVSTGGGTSLELLEEAPRDRTSQQQAQLVMSDELIIFGTPFPSVENDNKNFIPVWKQKAVSAKGTKRLHGAFEGGFSAGYFNSVGSKEGWKPAEFVSSRNKKLDQNESSKPIGNVEKYMDEEDLAEFNSKELIFLNNFKSNIAENVLKFDGMCEQSNLHFKEDQVSTLSKYLKREVICKSSNTSISSEAFSGGGAWDEDDEKVEMYETHSSLHQASKLIESSDKELDEMLHLAFGNVAFISTDNIIQSNYLPNDHFPKKVIGCTHVEISRPKLTSSTDKQEKYFDHRLEGIDEKTASAALKGFMPFAEDPEKQTRYIRYLRFCNGKSRKADDPKSGLYLDEKEHEEFIMSAQIFKPSSSLISSRFESSSTSLQPQITLKAGLSRPDSLKKLAPPRETEMPQIQKMNTKTNQSFPSRTTFIWMPASLLCKRFNVSPPETGFPSTVEPKKVKPALADESIEQLVNTLVKDSKHRFQLESSESRKNEKSEEEIPLLPSNDMFEEIFGPSSSENSEKRNRPKATDYFGSS